MPRLLAFLLLFGAAILSAADPAPPALYAWRDTKAELERIGERYLAKDLADGDSRLKRLAAQGSPYVDPRWATELGRLRVAEIDVRRVPGWSAVISYEALLERARSRQEWNDEIQAWCMAMLGRPKEAADLYRRLGNWRREAKTWEARAVVTECSATAVANLDAKLKFVTEIALAKLPATPLAEGLERRQALEALSRLTPLLQTTDDGDQRREIYRWIRIIMLRHRDEAGLRAWEDQLITEPSVRPHELAEIAVRRAFVAHQSGDVADAERLWRKVADEYPRTTSHVSARLNFGATLQHQQRYGEALAIYTELLRDPVLHRDAHAALSMRIAGCYEGLGKYVDSIAWVNKARALRPAVSSSGGCTPWMYGLVDEWKDNTLQALVARVRE